MLRLVCNECVTSYIPVTRLIGRIMAESWQNPAKDLFCPAIECFSYATNSAAIVVVV